MKDARIKSLLRKTPPTTEPRHDCPAEDLLAAFEDGGLAEPDHQKLVAHFADCDYCLSRLGILGRARDADAVPSIPGLVQAQARDLVENDGGRQWPVKTAPAWATAALVVLATGFILMQADKRSWEADAPAETVAAKEVTFGETRLIKPLASGPVLLWPRDGILLESTNQEFSWTEVADSLYYDLRIVSDDGNLVWQERVGGTRWSLPDGLNLQDDAEYFVRVDARLANSRSLNSDYVLFRYMAR